MAKEYFCLVCGGNVRTYTIVNNSPLQQNVLYENYSDARKTKTIDANFDYNVAILSSEDLYN